MNIKVLATIISKTCVSSPAVRMNLDFVFLNLAEAGAVNLFFRVILLCQIRVSCYQVTKARSKATEIISYEPKTLVTRNVPRNSEK